METENKIFRGRIQLNLGIILFVFNSDEDYIIDMLLTSFAFLNIAIITVVLIIIFLFQIQTVKN